MLPREQPGTPDPVLWRLKPFLSSLDSVLMVACLLSATMLQGCGAGGDRSPVVATLNGRALHKNHFERFLRTKMGDLGNVEASDSIRSQMLDEYLRSNLVLAEARRAGLSVS